MNATASKSTRGRKVPAPAIPPLNPGELEQTLGFVLRRAWVHMEQVFNKHLAEAGITTQLYAMLIVIENNPGCRISDVCRGVGVSPTNIVPALDTLLDRGLVFRDFSAHDRRAKRISLTETGVARLAELRELHQPLTEHFTRKLGAENMQTLVKLLSEMTRPDDG